MTIKIASKILVKLGFKKNYKRSNKDLVFFKYKAWEACVHIISEDAYFDFTYRFKGDKKFKIVCTRYRFETEEQLLFLVSNSLRSPLYKSKKTKTKPL